jgi:alpha-L-rhamnosidase
MAQSPRRRLWRLAVDRRGHDKEVAYGLLLTDTFPSWGYSIRQGATTIWEPWDGRTRDKGFQDPGTNGFNHYSVGSVGEWLYGTVRRNRAAVAGLRTAAGRAAASRVLQGAKPLKSESSWELTVGEWDVVVSP